MSTTTPYPSEPNLFGAYVADKYRKLPGWAYALFSGCVGITLVLLFVMWAKAIWGLERLEPPKMNIDLAVAPPPPPPPPPPPGGAKPHEVIITPKKIKVKDIVQPVKVEKVEKQETTEVGVEGGEEGGVEGGVVGGDINGVMGAPPPPPPPPPPPVAPSIVPPAALEASRIAGEKNIEPDDVTKTEIQRSGKDKIVGTFKLCLGMDGSVTSVRMLKSTSFGAYDNRILSTIQGTWRYRPFLVNGKAAPVCTAVTFIYSQK